MPLNTGCTVPKIWIKFLLKAACVTSEQEPLLRYVSTGEPSLVPLVPKSSTNLENKTLLCYQLLRLSKREPFLENPE